MSNSIEEPGEGHSIAVWTAVVIMLVGLSGATAALFLDAYGLVYVGAALVPVGLIIGYILRKAGFGVGGPRSGFHH